MMTEADKKKRNLIIILLVILGLAVGVVILGRNALYPAFTGEEQTITGEDAQIITNRFAVSHIDKCYYEIHGFFGGIGPSSYTIAAIVLLDEAESERIEAQYDWKTVQLSDTDQSEITGLYEGIGMEPVREWRKSAEWSKEFFADPGYGGSVWFSEEENCIFILAGSM